MTTLNQLLVVAIVAINALGSYAFLPQSSPLKSQFSGRTQPSTIHPRFQSPEQSVLARQRRSVANVQTMGLFGLGAGEIVLVLGAAAFIIGPEQLGKMAGSLKSDVPDELKKIPEEFQKGFEESTDNSKARNAKQMEALPEEEEQ
mmetsp:Transcript_13007/g.32833  ORF Transcript_13007/g.32833 Transcript_13007/m.32833 type:complete len:145 (-) Transcript_13007:301-735(-)